MMHLFSIFIQFVFATDINQLNSVQFEEINKAPAIVFEFEKPVQTASLETRFIRRTVEWDLDKTKLKKDKLFVNVSKKDINNVYVSHNDENSVRVRINLDNGKIASNYHERISYLTEGKKLTILMDESIPLISDNIKELSRVYDLAKSTPKNEQAKKAEEHIAAINTMKVEDAAESKELVASHNALATINAKESEIPLSLKKKTTSETNVPSLQRVAMGFFVLAILLVSGLLVTRKLKAKKAGAAFNHDSITVISQKYLGPKRNLTLIRVTGEYLLLGVTDNNISLIKSLNVVDDEIPELSGNKSFNQVLDKKEETLDEMNANEDDGFSVSSLDDVKKIFKKKRYIDEMDL